MDLFNTFSEKGVRDLVLEYDEYDDEEEENDES